MLVISFILPYFTMCRWPHGCVIDLVVVAPSGVIDIHVVAPPGVSYLVVSPPGVTHLILVIALEPVS